MPRQITAFSNPLVKQVARPSRQEEPAPRGPVPRRGPADPHRGARGRLCCPRSCSSATRAHPLLDAPDRRDRGGGRRGDRDQCRHPPQALAARTIRRPCSASIARFDTALDADRPRRRAALDRRPGAARSRQSRHHPAHRRRGRRRRADPGRRLRRSLLGRGGARLDGRAVHPDDRGGAAGTSSSPGCAPARAS